MTRVSPGSLLSLCAAAALLLAAGCSRTPTPAAAPGGTSSRGRVIAVETFLADLTRQVSAGRFDVRSLVPLGVDPHGYEPTPQDIAAVADAAMVVVNGAGLEGFLQKLIDNAGGSRPVVEASAGLESRTGREGEVLEGGTIATGPATEPDPHFWLNPVNTVQYVENIRDAFVTLDPAGASAYRTAADSLIARLQDLDRWIAAQVARIPALDRKLVTNHESLGYFADRYGFRIVGTVIPSVSSEASPTARQLARLVDGLRAAGVRAVFLETGANPQLADQVAREAGITVVTSVFTHSLSDAAGPAGTYIDMMRHDVTTIVEALAGAAP